MSETSGQRGHRAEKVQTAEDLRTTYVRKFLESGGLKVVGDAKSQKKYDGGRAAKVQTILGLIYDCTDPTNPTTGLPEAKQRDL